jgi:imidazolonepropionase-like amidohydrolase
MTLPDARLAARSAYEGSAMPQMLLRNATLIDGIRFDMQPGSEVLIEEGIIREVAQGPIASPSAEVLDLRGRTLMPGLIDCHVHVIAATADLAKNAAMPSSLVAAYAARIMEGMLRRGFTSVRDAGGADHGLVLAQESGLIKGPRLFISGKALTQTGGHADYRGRFDRRTAEHYADRLGTLGRVADGVAEVRRAAREEIKAGARFIKIMANGGISSPTDPIHFFGYSREEITAAVEEAESAGTYVLAHLYTDDAIRRAVECGVRSIEHGNLVTPNTAQLMEQRGAFVVPTLVTFDALAEEGASLGLPSESVAKIEAVRSAGLASLEAFRAAGVPMGYGTDLLGDMHRHQSREFLIRKQVLPAPEIIASATSVAARILGMDGKLGIVAPAALADLIVVEGNPLEDVALLTTGIRAVMLGGTFVEPPRF